MRGRRVGDRGARAEGAGHREAAQEGGRDVGRGLHSSTSQLNLSRLCHSKYAANTQKTRPRHSHPPLNTLLNTPYPTNGAYVELESGRV